MRPSLSITIFHLIIFPEYAGRQIQEMEWEGRDLKVKSVGLIYDHNAYTFELLPGLKAEIVTRSQQKGKSFLR